jgi:hypothetical protein
MVNEAFLPESVRLIKVKSMVDTLAMAEKAGSIPALSDEGRSAFIVALDKGVPEALEEARTNPKWKNLGQARGLRGFFKKILGT